MAAVCQVTGAVPGFGHNISHSHRRTKRRWNPNIQVVHSVDRPGGNKKRVNACTSCIKAGKVVRGYIGVTIQDFSAESAEALGLKDVKGAIVAELVPGGPAAKAGLLPAFFTGAAAQGPSTPSRARVAQLSTPVRTVMRGASSGSSQRITSAAKRRACSGTWGQKARVTWKASGRLHRRGCASRRGSRKSSTASTTSRGG